MLTVTRLTRRLIAHSPVARLTTVRPMDHCDDCGFTNDLAADGDADRDPAAVARQLRDAAALFADVLDRLGPDRDRTAVYSYPQPSERSLRWIAVHTEHEVRHHLLDVRRQLS